MQAESMASKVVVITGASSGIGQATAMRLGGEGNQVVLAARRTDRLADIAAKINADGGTAVARAVDVTDRGDVAALVDGVVSEFGRLDVFVNNAGTSRWRAVDDLDEAFVAEIVETSVLGTLWGCAAAARVLAERGSIVMISSLAGKRGSANNSVYCAARPADCPE